MIRFFQGLVISYLIVVMPALASDARITSWGLSVSESAAPYVGGLRYTCAEAPEVCIKKFEIKPSIKAIAISFTDYRSAEKNLDNAAEYAEIASRFPVLKEVGIDDFLAFITKVPVSNRAAYLTELVNKAKSNNSGLLFGLTIYEDQINRLEKESAILPNEVRGKIDRIAFYLHHRANYKTYTNYLNRLRKLFPNAKIYAGVYHYDRVDYLRCSQSERRNCSDNEELELFREALDLQMDLFKTGQVDGLEFYPGFFGKENSWYAWSRPRICSSARREKCVENSKVMGQEVLQKLQQNNAK
ncbi:hypothetical protein [Pigmentiphaga sp. NML080357]|uniref:hypothetical protein n=1 Tax=Pigmentiphaga sp. NML080357 TaxID=2008675 RepID=UPI00118612C9|nr:hypothetical protein [Pigmentiphaga sp. NML080357]